MTCDMVCCNINDFISLFDFEDLPFSDLERLN